MPSARRHLCRIAVGLALLVVPAAAVAQVFVDAAGTCAGMTPCFMTIQAGVNNASANNSLVVVFPGTYAESVNLSLMGSAVAQPGGDIVIINYVKPRRRRHRRRPPLRPDGWPRSRIS